MKFGRYLRAQSLPEWAEYYMDYKKLKDIIKALSEVEKAIDVMPGKTGFGERVTSLSMVPKGPDTASLYDGKNITEADFFGALEQEMKKVDQFTQTQIRELQNEVSSLASEATNAGQGEREALLKRAKSLGDAFLKLEKFVNLNLLGFHKILKKHDKNLSVPCQRFYMTRLHEQTWIKHDYSKLFVTLSKIHAKLRGDTAGENEGGTAQDFIRTTSKYWVRTEDISKIKHIVLQHLPVFQHQLDALEGDSQLTNSVYFDNAQMELYHGRLDKTPDAIAIRLRWYATELPDLVFVERKTHRDSWTGDISVKERFTIKESQVLPFLKGEYTVEDKVAEMRKKKKSEKDIANVQRLFNEIYNQLDSKQLRPTMRTQYMRVAYQIPFDATVRISLDTNLTMIAENPKVGPDCATEGRWYRNPNIVVPPTEYTNFPHGVLEVKLSLKEGQSTPQWVQDLIDSGLVTEVHKFSKYLHGCATLLSSDVQAVPYWVDDESIRPSMLRSQPYEKKRSMIENGNGVKTTARSPFEFGEAKTINLMQKKQSMQYGSINGNTESTAHLGPIYGGRQEASWLSYLLTCCGLLDESAGRQAAKPRKIPMKVEPKVFLANERTLLSWVHMSVYLGSIASLLLSAAAAGETADGGPTKGARIGYIVGMLLLPVSILFIMYALSTFYWRGKRIRSRTDGQLFHDTLGPTVLATLLMIALGTIFTICLLDGVGVPI